MNLSDFDMSGNLLHINKTYNRIRKRDVIDTPKTENSVRTIDIPNFLKEEVKKYAKKHYGFPEDQRLFPIVARTLQKRLKKYEALTGVKPIRVHDIRHSHVAYLIYQGVEPLIIKERLGPVSYTHLDPMYNNKVVTKLINNIMLDGKKGVAQKIVYGAFARMEEKTGKPAIEVFEEAMNNIMPQLEVKARRIGGATYQMPDLVTLEALIKQALIKNYL